MLISGIDPGVKGAISILDSGKIVELIATPMFNGEIDYNEFLKISNRMLEMGVEHVFLEHVHAIFGVAAKATFHFGQAYGAARLITSRFPHTLVQPKVWQKEMWQGLVEQRLPGKFNKNTGKMGKSRVDTKLMSAIAAKRLFPETNFYQVSQKTGKILSKIDDGKTDAALVASYGHRMLTRGITPELELVSAKTGS